MYEEKLAPIKPKWSNKHGQ